MVENTNNNKPLDLPPNYYDLPHRIITRHFYTYPQDIKDDLAQEGFEEMLLAWKAYDPERGTFEKYASFRVEKRMRAFTGSVHKPVRLPTKVARKASKSTDYRIRAAALTPAPIEEAENLPNGKIDAELNEKELRQRIRHILSPEQYAVFFLRCVENLPMNLCAKHLSLAPRQIKQLTEEALEILREHPEIKDW